MGHMSSKLRLKRPAGASARPAPEPTHPAPEPLPSSDEEPGGTAPIAGPAPVPLEEGREKRKWRRVQQKVEAKMLKRDEETNEEDCEGRKSKEDDEGEEEEE